MPVPFSINTVVCINAVIASGNIIKLLQGITLILLFLTLVLMFPSFIYIFTKSWYGKIGWYKKMLERKIN